jgi:hypothetical protein
MIATAVSVVPIPSSARSVAAFSNTAELARTIAASSASPLAIAARRASNAVALATSPAL